MIMERSGSAMPSAFVGNELVARFPKLESLSVPARSLLTLPVDDESPDDSKETKRPHSVPSQLHTLSVSALGAQVSPDGVWFGRETVSFDLLVSPDAPVDFRGVDHQIVQETEYTCLHVTRLRRLLYTQQDGEQDGRRSASSTSSISHRAGPPRTWTS